MKNITLLIAAFLITSTLYAQKQKSYIVTNAAQFFEVLGSDRLIELDMDILMIPNDEESQPLVLKDYQNLHIKGYKDTPTKILTPEENWTVLSIEKSKNITLENLEIGHGPIPTTRCGGDVISLKDVDSVSIISCTLFGSGFGGIFGSDILNFSMNNSLIYGCSGYISAFVNSENVTFDNTKFKDNSGDMTAIQFYNCKNVLYKTCEFSLNRSTVNPDLGFVGNPMFSAEKSDTISLQSSKIMANQYPYLFNKKTAFSVDKTEIFYNNITERDYQYK